MSTYRLALIGFGNVGQALARVIHDNAAWYESTFGMRLRINVVVDAQKGSAYNSEGLDIAALLANPNQLGHSGDANTLIRSADYDILCEMSYTNLETGEPATSYIRTALARSKHVVTTNKGPVALFYPELLAVAQANNVRFGVEGTVMSGTPTLRIGQAHLKGARIQKLEGILNGTTNYMLSRMADGLSYAQALREAQDQGYAEADPSNDVEGVDTAGKIVILAQVLLDTPLKITDVHRQGISHLTAADINAATAAGERWKLIGTLEQRPDGTIRAEVQPRRLPSAHPLAGVMGATNALTYTTQLLGQTTIIGAGAGRRETAYALLQDILAIGEGQ